MSPKLTRRQVAATLAGAATLVCCPTLYSTAAPSPARLGIDASGPRALASDTREGTPGAETSAPDSPADELQAARERLRGSLLRLSKTPLAIEIEPAFRFQA